MSSSTERGLNRTEQLKAILNRNKNLKTNQSPTLPKNVQRAELKANTLAAVRQMLANTKDERRKRGRYHKYSAEIQEQMARHAIAHGNHDAVRFFSQRLGCTVSESTIRNIVKLHRSFSSEIKEEIGRFAAAFGIDTAANHFTTRLGREVRQGMVRKLKKLYLRRYPDQSGKSHISQRDRNNASTSVGVSSSKKQITFRYTNELKEEIGSHACSHAISDTIRHYSTKLPILLKCNTVRRFRKLYLDKLKQLQSGSQESFLSQQVQETTSNARNCFETSEPCSDQTIEILNSSLNVLNNSQINQSYHPTFSHDIPITFHPLSNSTNNVPSHTPISYHYSQAPTSAIANRSEHIFNESVNPLQTYSQQTRHEFISFEPTDHKQSLPSSISLSQQSIVNNSQHTSPHSQTSTMTVVVPSSQTQQSFSSPTVISQQNQSVNSSMIGQHSLLLSHQQLLQLQQQKQEQVNIQLINGSEETPSGNSVQQNISPTLLQSINNTGQFSYSNSFPLLIADRNGTYTLTAALNTDDSYNLENHSSSPIILKLKPHPQECIQDNNTQTVSEYKCPETQTPKAQGNSKSNALPTKKGNVKLTDESLTFFEVQIDCSHVENCTDSRGYNDEDEEEIDRPPTPNTPEVRQEEKVPKKKKASKKKKENLMRRGQYTTYSPELRAEMGKYAAEHGSQRTCQHFRTILGHDIPESTVRGLRDKYLLKREQKADEVTSLGYSPRGRPVRLGKYDEIVQEIIRELVKTGEKVSSFLAITTAKQVLMQYDPSLLEENGGNIRLNITWAKSFLKRIGIHNNS